MTQSDTANRVVRTVFQALAAAAVSLPVLTASLHLSAATSAKVVGIAAAVMVVITTIHNRLEDAGLMPAMLKGTTVPTVTGTAAGDVVAATQAAPQVVAVAQEVDQVAAVAENVVKAAKATKPKP